MYAASPPPSPWVRLTHLLAVMSLAVLVLSASVAAPAPEPVEEAAPEFIEVPVERLEVELSTPDDPEPLPMRVKVDGRDPFTPPTLTTFNP